MSKDIDSSKDKVAELKKVLEGKKGESVGGLEQAAPKRTTPTGATPERAAPERTEDEWEAQAERLKIAEGEVRDFRDKYLRAVADLENYKKRVAKEYEERSQFVQERILKEFLPVLDDFDRVLAHLPSSHDPSIQTVIQGVGLVHKHLEKIMRDFGLEAVEAEGLTFDPHLHEAVATRDETEIPEGKVAQVTRKGYKMGKTLLRPAQVIVAKTPEQKGI